jgi:acetyl/propionyl-CoA carboxylase alpha subunit
VHEIAVRPLGQELEVVVDGEPHRMGIERTAPGVFLCRLGTRVETLHCVRDGTEIHLFWRGRAYRITEEAGVPRAPRGTSGGLEAPMPGRVIAVRVAPGAVVAKGQELVVVEAMKMENALRAPRDGVVRAVTVKPGDMASPGAILVELE